MSETHAVPKNVKIPDYLEATYWWAYVRPWAVKIFEREWLINLILWGQYRQLRDAALKAFGDHLSGRNLQVACVYGDLTVRLYERISTFNGSLDVVDVLNVQLNNLKQKLPADHTAGLLHMDSSNLFVPDDSYDRGLLFFLLHEQPKDIREKTINELFRVVKPGGSIIIVDFSKPHWWNPLRYIWLPILGVLEPFASDLWSHDNPIKWLPQKWAECVVEKEVLFAGLYQIVCLTRPY